jgi:hypothetical protein
MAMRQRSKVRLGMKVIHRHQVGSSVFRRVSELVFINGKPKALLGWINIGGVRTPIYICDLDPDKLHRSAGEKAKNTYYYDDVTLDPRYEDVKSSALGLAFAPDVAQQDDQDEGHTAGGRG